MVTHKLRRRRAQRGAAVFMVVMMITMLMGIGLFAARSATLSTAASGFERQMTQTHYVTQYGILSTAAELSSSRRAAYIKQMSASPDAACSSGVLAAKVSNYTCYRFGYADLQQMMQVGNAGQTFIVPANTSAKTPGSLGVADLEADWLVEMSDLAPATPPVPGMDLTSAGAANIRYMVVTLTATGQVRPRSSGATATLPSAITASIETTRAHLVVGPMPKL
jgi:hypothetical protein